jgi:hypothetical protein
MKKLLVILIVLGLAAPALAQPQVTTYGSLRPHLSYVSLSQDFVGGPALDGTINTAGGTFRDEGVLLNISQSTRAGFRAKMSDSTSAVLEFWIRSGDANATNVGTRLFFGDWNFGPGSLRVGQDHPVATFLGYSNMFGAPTGGGDGNMLGMGLPYASRNPLIRLDIAGASLALVQNSGVPVLGFEDADRWLPRIEAAYVFRTPVIAIRPILAYQNFRVENRAPGGDDRSIESYMAGLGVSLTLGPAFVKATGTWGQNVGNMAMGQAALVGGGLTTATGVDDAETYTGTLVAGFNVSPTFFIEAGVGYANTKVDAAPGVEVKSDGFIVYLQTPITLARGFQLIPEVGQLDRGDLKVSGQPDLAQGRSTYASAIFKIDF